MQEKTLSIAFAFFPYGGTGSTASEYPGTRNWIVPTIMKASADPRIEAIYHKDFSDTPITMSRNAAVKWAQQEVNADILYMLDSDMIPDINSSEPDAKPFFDESFNFLYGN